MPLFLSRYDQRFGKRTAANIAEERRKDLEMQNHYGVRFLCHWSDGASGTDFCLIDAPDRKTAMRVHRDAHGGEASDLMALDLSAVVALLDRIPDPVPTAADWETAAPSFCAVLFTDIVDFTSITARLGDVKAVDMVHEHDVIVRRALKNTAGREIKRTGDGMMASFRDVSAAVACACFIQQAFDMFNHDRAEHLRVRIGIHAGEPVEDNNDLLGCVVQVASRICQNAEADTVVVSDIVHNLVVGRFEAVDLGLTPLKGLVHPAHLYRISCASIHESPLSC
ncbi:nickel-binding protein [Azospirillum brasilense]|uniref:nickel-binding protein n=1 Tax=Azospirillum brasilense TaxID=192 RepID=UPI001EDB3678|nr:nickel-binding protein [Azospirillum brasilense]UKJ76635.1 DUF4242 domain-containing protein [Azospirillum brasilense]